MSRPLRVVLDTNVVLSALLFSQGRLAALRHAWQEGRFTPLISPDTISELVRVLGYPKFRLDEGERQELLADYLPWCAAVRIPNPPPDIPPCRDHHDRPFLLLAVAGQADFLVSGDQDLLDLAGQIPCPIVTSDAFLRTVT